MAPSHQYIHPIRTSRKTLVVNRMLADTCGRTITYLRLAVTDRCNLRCRYCMPKEGIAGINLRLDSLDPDRFAAITGQYVLDEVKDTLERLVRAGITVKVNVVVQDGINSDEIATLAALAETRPITVRFIEQMPFNGGKGPVAAHRWDTGQILAELGKNFPTMHRSLKNSGTARCYIIPGFAGTIGIIGAYS